MSRLALRIIPILLILYQTLGLLRAMRCQTSPNYPLLRYNDPSKHFEHDYSAGDGPLYWISSRVLFWQSDKDSCVALNMVPRDFNPPEGVKRAAPRGSLSLIWPLFMSLCTSQFVETLSCAVQGRPVLAETGMTIFEHSLAFAEAEAMMGSQFGWGPFGLPTTSSPKSSTASSSQLASSAASLVSRSVVLDRLNTPPEVLLIGLISSLSHLSSQILGVLALQGRFRLFSTGLWGLCFMSAFSWSLITFTPGPSGDTGILRFPTVCIVGFIPHMLILVGIFTCALIYLLALLLSASAPPGQPRSIKERFLLAQQNLQANIQLSTIRINVHEDFYTSLLKVGFAALTAASEAVFLNEGQPVGVRPWTWLEEDRITEIESARNGQRRGGGGFLRGQDFRTGDGTPVADGVGLVEAEDEESNTCPRRWKSGYAKERSTEKLKADSSGKARVRGDGVGAAERSGRWFMAWDLFRGIFWLFVGAFAVLILKTLDSLNFRARPAWITRLARREKGRTEARRLSGDSEPRTLEFWLLSEDGVLRLPEDGQVDVEVEMRKRLMDIDSEHDEADEMELDENIYGWWKQGGWFGDLDASGSYKPDGREDDTTSVITTITNTSEDDWESDGGSDAGRRTPTQSNPFPPSREDTPSTADDATLDLSHLGRLLDPRNSSDRREAQLLAHHLHSPTILTRSRFQKSMEHRNARVLTSTRYRPTSLPASAPLSPTEEAELLEHLIVSRRAYVGATSSSSGQESTWAAGAEGLGAGGPQCVVCQSSPRTILVWPCRCLSLCEDCRVSLAMNNFGNCVCCRRDVVGFSRLFVP